MFEVWTKEFGTVSTHDTLLEAVAALKEYASEAGVSWTATFTGGHFTDDEGRRYVAREV